MRFAVDWGVQRDHPDRGAGVRPYFGAVQLEDEVRVAVGDQRRLVELGGHVDHGEHSQPSGDPVEASKMCKGAAPHRLVALFG